MAKLLKLMETEAEKLIKDKENAEKRAESLSQKQVSSESKPSKN